MYFPDFLTIAGELFLLIQGIEMLTKLQEETFNV